jgi:hypothetical protein
MGPEEAVKSLLTAWYLGTQISSTSTVRLRYSIDEGANWTTWATFTTAYSKSTLATPVLFRSLMLEIALAHTAGSTNTPNGLPILIEGVAVWPSLRHWRAFLNPADREFVEKYGTGGIEKLWTNLTTLEATNPVNTLKPGQAVSKLATWAGLHTAYDASLDPATVNAAALPSDGQNYLDFIEVLQ